MLPLSVNYGIFYIICLSVLFLSLVNICIYKIILPFKKITNPMLMLTSTVLYSTIYVRESTNVSKMCIVVVNVTVPSLL